MNRLNIVAIVAAGLLLVTLSACSSPASGASVAGTSDTSHMSSAEAAEMADGNVTADEYQTAFRRYQACMKKAGWTLLVGNSDSYLIQYSFPTAGTKDDARCYALEFGAVDDAWQLENVDRDSTTIALKQCLVNAGITPGKTRAEIDDQLAAAGIKEQTCLSNQ